MVISMNRWAGKVAIVTGAGSGIGAAIADALVLQGLKVVGIARRSERIQERAKKFPPGTKGQLYGVKADLTKESDILEAFAWTTKNLGPVHILVNNAGTIKFCDLTELETKDLKAAFDLNVLALCICTREAVKIMKDNNVNGHIVHINAILGHTVLNLPKFNVYPACKFATTALTETLRQELVRLGSKIKISSVSPGRTESELTTENPNITPEQRKFFSHAIIKAEDVADAVVYVLSTPEHAQVHELMLRAIEEA